MEDKDQINDCYMPDELTDIQVGKGVIKYIETLRASYEDLKKDYQDLHVDSVEFKAQVDSTYKNNKRLKEKLNDANAKIEELTTKVAKLEEAVDRSIERRTIRFSPTDQKSIRYTPK